MKRIILILCAVMALLFITIVLQNRFLLGAPFVHEKTTASVEADRILGNRYAPISMDSSPPGEFGRLYFAHFGSYILFTYEVDFNRDEPDASGHIVNKGKVSSVHWQKFMGWDKQRFLDVVDRLAKQQ